MALPFGRQTSREALEETTRSIKSSLTEGSSRIFGSVMGAKRGLIGGLTSTFDQVVNIVGGGEGDPDPATGTPGGESVGSGEDGPNQTPTKPKQRPPKPPAPPIIRQRSDLDPNGVINGRVSRQNTVPASGPQMGPHGGTTNAEANTTTTTTTTSSPDFADGKQRRKIDAKPPLKRRNTNPFMDDYDPSAVEPDYPPSSATGDPSDPGAPPPPQPTQDPSHSTGGGEDGAKVAPAPQRSSEPSKAWNTSGKDTLDRGRPEVVAAPPLAAPGRDLFAITPTSGAALPDPEIIPDRWRGDNIRPGADDEGEDSEGTEGCDDELDEEDRLAVIEGPDGGPDGGTLDHGSGGNPDQQSSWGCSPVGGGGGGGGEEGELDPVSVECIDFMKYFVQKIFDPSQDITARDKAKFGELCLDGFGRLWFAKCVNTQRVNNKRVSEETFYALVQFFIIVLFECNEAEDYGPAKTLMNMCFTFHCEAAQGSNVRPKKQFLYSFLKDQPIWQSPRFWNAAFFYAVQQERASKPVATSNEKKEEKQDDCSFQENITFGQLGTFTSNMRAFGLTKEQCLEFIRKQATIANLPPGQIKQLRQRMENWTEEALQ